jgi:hypothetical protein
MGRPVRNYFQVSILVYELMKTTKNKIGYGRGIIGGCQNCKWVCITVFFLLMDAEEIISIDANVNIVGVYLSQTKAL